MIVLKDIIQIKRRKIVLDNISLEIGINEIIGVVGSNGAGKSSLLKIISGIEKPSSGSIEKKDGITTGIFIENGYYLKNFTGYEFLNYYLIQLGFQDKKINEQLILKCVDLLNMQDFIQKKIKTYSQGMLQRVGIGCSIINNPNLVIFDEPTNFLDIESKLLFRKIIRYLKDKGTTVIIASHQLDEVEEFCNRIYVMRDGEIINSLDMNSDVERIYTVTLTGNINEIKSIKYISNVSIYSEDIEIEIVSNKLDDLIKDTSLMDLKIKKIRNVNKIEKYIVRV